MALLGESARADGRRVLRTRHGFPGYRCCVPEVLPVVDVSEWPVRDPEPGGSGENVWLSDPGDSRSWLFKLVSMPQGQRQGQDWAEALASRLAALISVPTAQAEMAVRLGRPGSISLDLTPTGWSLHTGAVALQEVDVHIDPKSKDGHSLGNIRRALADCGAPPGFSGPASFGAYDVFAGFLVFDAWIANADRHEANWSLLHSAAGHRLLAASYDHAGALGAGLRDQARDRGLADPVGIDRWVLRGLAKRFEG